MVIVSDDVPPERRGAARAYQALRGLPAGADVWVDGVELLRAPASPRLAAVDGDARREARRMIAACASPSRPVSS
jgi:hypothetical protein